MYVKKKKILNTYFEGLKISFNILAFVIFAILKELLLMIS